MMDEVSAPDKSGRELVVRSKIQSSSNENSNKVN
nr:MAG TPA: hypothetical protein [Caudoviricetes sp.]